MEQREPHIGCHPFKALFGPSHRLLDVAPAACDKPSLDLVDLATSICGHDQYGSLPRIRHSGRTSCWVQTFYLASGPSLEAMVASANPDSNTHCGPDAQPLIYFCLLCNESHSRFYWELSCQLRWPYYAESIRRLTLNVEFHISHV